MLTARSALACAALLALGLGAEVASAQPVDEETRSAARALGTSGVRAYLDGDAALASARLERSFALFPTPTLGLWSARALAKLGSLVEAAERYAEVSRLSADVGDVATQAAAQRDAERERAELLPRIPRLSVRIAGTPRGQPKVTLDGRALDGLDAVALNPGRHEVAAEDERGRVSKAVVLEERQQQSIELLFDTPLGASPAPSAAPVGPAGAPPRSAPSAAVGAALPAPGLPASGFAAPAEPSSSRDGPVQHSGDLSRTVGWVAVGLGGAALATALVTYFVGNSEHGELAGDARCSDDVCQPALQEKVDHYSTIRALNIAGWIGAGAFGATGITLLWLSREPSGDVELTATGNSVSVRGTF